MAIMNLNVRAPIIILIGRVFETSNSCISLFTFSVNTIEGNSVTIDLVQGVDSPQTYETAQISIDGGASNVPITSGNSFVLPNGTATVEISIGNTGTEIYNCNKITVTVTDLAVGTSKEKDLFRCNNYTRC